MERRFAAIRVADVVEFSYFVGAEEEGRLRTLGAFRLVTVALVAEHSGRVFGGAGDSVIAAFSCAESQSHLYSRS